MAQKPVLLLQGIGAIPLNITTKNYKLGLWFFVIVKF
jgi:hypothetical protein